MVGVLGPGANRTCLDELSDVPGHRGPQEGPLEVEEAPSGSGTLEPVMPFFQSPHKRRPPLQQWPTGIWVKEDGSGGEEVAEFDEGNDSFGGEGELRGRGMS